MPLARLPRPCRPPRAAPRPAPPVSARKRGAAALAGAAGGAGAGTPARGCGSPHHPTPAILRPAAWIPPPPRPPAPSPALRSSRPGPGGTSGARVRSPPRRAAQPCARLQQPSLVPQRRAAGLAGASAARGEAALGCSHQQLQKGLGGVHPDLVFSLMSQCRSCFQLFRCFHFFQTVSRLKEKELD